MTLNQHELTNLRTLIDFARGTGSQPLSDTWEKIASELYEKLGTMREIADKKQTNQ